MTDTYADYFDSRFNMRNVDSYPLVDCVSLEQRLSQAINSTQPDYVALPSYTNASTRSFTLHVVYCTFAIVATVVALSRVSDSLAVSIY